MQMLLFLAGLKQGFPFLGLEDSTHYTLYLQEMIVLRLHQDRLIKNEMVLFLEKEGVV